MKKFVRWQTQFAIRGWVYTVGTFIGGFGVWLNLIGHLSTKEEIRGWEILPMVVGLVSIVVGCALLGYKHYALWNEEGRYAPKKSHMGRECEYILHNGSIYVKKTLFLFPVWYEIDISVGLCDGRHPRFYDSNYIYVKNMEDAEEVALALAEAKKAWQERQPENLEVKEFKV